MTDPAILLAELYGGNADTRPCRAYRVTFQVAIVVELNEDDEAHDADEARDLAREKIHDGLHLGQLDYDDDECVEVEET